jgi:hypothetical protein
MGVVVDKYDRPAQQRRMSRKRLDVVEHFGHALYPKDKKPKTRSPPTAALTRFAS